MIVIFEGADQTGKTTACKRFSNELGFLRLDNSWSPAVTCSPWTHSDEALRKMYRDAELERLWSMVNVMQALACNSSANIVIDRFTLSQFVYGSYYELMQSNSHPEKLKAWSEINKRLMLLSQRVKGGVKLVHCMYSETDKVYMDDERYSPDYDNQTLLDHEEQFSWLAYSLKREALALQVHNSFDVTSVRKHSCDLTGLIETVNAQL